VTSPKVLVVGAGAREHAILDALARSPQQPELICAPGNAGIAQIARLAAVRVDDVPGLLQLAQDEQVDLVVIGPEAPLVAGLADALQDAEILCFGPTRAGAELEGSKSFCKEVMEAVDVPTAAYRVVTSVDAGLSAITEVQGERWPAVIKADGLAAGKGVVIAADREEARQALTDLLVDHKFGTDRVVVEEFMAGEECSLLAICDGTTALPLVSAQDYKRIFDGDKGPNTGGMGCYSPIPAIDAAEAQRIVARIHQPVLDELRRRGIEFRGVLYAGLMLTDAEIKVVEFNARFGDPETEVILPRLRSDLLQVLIDAANGQLGDRELEWDPRPGVTVVLASAGYPESSSSGDVITGLDQVGAETPVMHAGTATDQAGNIVTAGGRVLCVTALGDSFAAARDSAYAAVNKIQFPGRQMRRDIAQKVVDA
jgi:phosphoribosylamine---glycine ligase